MESVAVLAGGVAHDLNNMLGPLVGYSELILLKLPEDSPIRKKVESIGKSAEQAANVIQDLLTLARRGRYEMSPTNMNDVVSSFLNSPTFDKLTRSNPSITLVAKLDEDIEKIMGSAPHLAKTIMNLIINAFEATPVGGRITVETEQVFLEKLLSKYDDIEAGDYILLRVSDTGSGIPSGDIEKIFEPYYSKKEMNTSGSGLGLSVVYGVVKDHKGYYDVCSREGKGTEFTLYFPVSHDEVQSDSSREPRVNIHGSERVLVVDDNEDQRNIVLELLCSLGYEVETVNGGREAVEYLKTHCVDILVLDMIMEDDFDGLDSYQEIIKIHPSQKAIIVSGFSSTDRVNKMQELGAGSYVKKPFTRVALGMAIRQELETRCVECV